MKRVGAGGNWKRIDEKFDAGIIKQTSGLSCVSAVGEMLLRQRGITLSQQEIVGIIGEPAHISLLAEVLNKFDISEDGREWYGITVRTDSLKTLLKEKNWAAVLREPQTMGHTVLIDGTENRLIKIKDPFDQTAYLMTIEDFLENWNGEVIFRWRF
jgi:ABC-type bacteriocin/lantibiotic exporter with double-glycine peptidase domain